ncbi:MAG: hypothetical protein ABIA12_00330 [Candidatus Aenigmatarchaeota archaeon]
MDWRRIVSKARAEEGEDGVEPGSSDVLADGIADIIVEAERRNAAELGKLRVRVETLERRLSKKQAAAVPQEAGDAKAGRERSEPSEMELLLDLHGQIEDLRTSMVKLSNRMKALAGE